MQIYEYMYMVFRNSTVFFWGFLLDEAYDEVAYLFLLLGVKTLEESSAVYEIHPIF
ncbi:hypothetical protein KAU88_06725 [Candidatus Bathyarchaeota archaeon]|nr:hypothetical protein [Candidatus Bathyarchaeota archaeon]